MTVDELRERLLNVYGGAQVLIVPADGIDEPAQATGESRSDYFLIYGDATQAEA